MAAPIFLHGLLSHPSGTKARWLAERYGCFTPHLDTSSIETALPIARAAISERQPSVVIGSSFGGAVLLRLVLDGGWRGPCVFLAQAGVRTAVGDRVLAGVRAVVIHGSDDAVIPVADSVLLARNSGPEVELIIVEGGDHRLSIILEDGTLAAALAALGVSAGTIA